TDPTIVPLLSYYLSNSLSLHSFPTRRSSDLFKCFAHSFLHLPPEKAPSLPLSLQEEQIRRRSYRNMLHRGRKSVFPYLFRKSTPTRSPDGRLPPSGSPAPLSAPCRSSCRLPVPVLSSAHNPDACLSCLTFCANPQHFAPF